MLPNAFKPHQVEKRNLIRLGPKYDGGYIVHKKSLEIITLIITCGLNDDWNFEKEFLKKKPLCKVVAYDHTVNNNFWLSYSLNNFINLLLLKKLKIKKIIDVFKYIDYKLFFLKKNIHIEKKIGKKNNTKEISINKIFKCIKKNEKIILKIDIEGDEYKVLEDVKNVETHLDHLIIEFHHVKKNLSTIEMFVKKNKLLKLIHIHGNNYSPVRKGIPDTLEMTFVNKKNYLIKAKKSKYEYPLKGIDYPNLKRREDISLNFYAR